MAGSLDLTDTDLSDLFDRYPDITFDTAEDISPACGLSEHFSSPSSDVTNLHETPTSKKGVSTAHTTPLRHTLRCPKQPESPSFDQYLEKLRDADLPSKAISGFENLACGMTSLGSLLVSQNDDYYEVYLDSSKPKILDQVQPMLLGLQETNDKVADEVDNVDFVKTRAPFQVQPGEADLWCTYRQRAKLIGQYLSLPCRMERDLLEDLIHLFDAYIYNAFLELLSLGKVDTDMECGIHQLYDVLMTLLHNYNMWMKGMKELKDQYMSPLMTRIQKCPEVRYEIATTEYAKEMAKAWIGVPEGPGMQPVDERVIQELNLSTSRRHTPIPKRARSRYRREHTV